MCLGVIVDVGALSNNNAVHAVGRVTVVAHRTTSPSVACEWSNSASRLASGSSKCAPHAAHLWLPGSWFSRSTIAVFEVTVTDSHDGQRRNSPWGVDDGARSATLNASGIVVTVSLVWLFQASTKPSGTRSWGSWSVVRSSVQSVQSVGGVLMLMALPRK